MTMRGPWIGLRTQIKALGRAAVDHQRSGRRLANNRIRGDLLHCLALMCVISPRARAFRTAESALMRAELLTRR